MVLRTIVAPSQKMRCIAGPAKAMITAGPGVLIVCMLTNPGMKKMNPQAKIFATIAIAPRMNVNVSA